MTVSTYGWQGVGSALCLLLAAFCVTEAAADDSDTATSVRPLGPLDTAHQVYESELTQRGAFSLGADFQSVGQIASDCIGEDCEDSGVGGITRLFGSWAFMRDTNHPGALVARIESRNKIGTDIPPEDLGFASLGYVGFTAIDYSDIGVGLPELYWRQQFLGKTPVELRVGRMAPVAFFDVTPFSDNLTGFTNLSMIFSPTVTYALPGSLGAVGYVGVTKHIYALGTILDANGEWDGGGNISKGEYFKGLEFGWTEQNTGGFYLMDNYHVSFWDKDETEAIGAGDGISIAGSRWFEEGGWGAFLRAGWAAGQAFLEKSAAIGFTKHVGARNDYTGIALSWGRPFDSDVNQYSSEFFYRFQVNKYLAITPSLQLLIDPALNEQDDKIWVAGLRIRIAP